MVASQQVTLHLEHILRIAEVLAQLIGDLCLRLDDVREHTLPSLEHRVILVELVEVHSAVIGIDGGLDRVANIADLVIDQALGGAIGIEGVLGGVGKRGTLGVRQGLQGGIAIHNPLQAAINHGRVSSGIGGQPRSNLLYALARIAVIQQLGLAANAVREQEVQLAILGGIHGAIKDIANANAALAVIGIGGAIGVVLDRVIAGLAGNRIIHAIGRAGNDRAVVDARLVYLNAKGLLGVLGLAFALGLAGLGLQVRHGKDGEATAGRTCIAGYLVDLIGLGCHKTVAVGVDGVAVNPVRLILPQLVRI